MEQVPLDHSDLVWMRRWGINAAADTRTAAETEARFAVPEWLRRPCWRQFWVGHDTPARSAEQAGATEGMGLALPPGVLEPLPRPQGSVPAPSGQHQAKTALKRYDLRLVGGDGLDSSGAALRSGRIGSTKCGPSAQDFVLMAVLLLLGFVAGFLLGMHLMP